MGSATIKHKKNSRKDCQMARERHSLYTKLSLKNDNINCGCTIQAFISTYPTYPRVSITWYFTLTHDIFDIICPYPKGKIATKILNTLYLETMIFSLKIMCTPYLEGDSCFEIIYTLKLRVCKIIIPCQHYKLPLTLKCCQPKPNV